MRKRQQVSEVENTNEGGRVSVSKKEDTGKSGRENRWLREQMSEEENTVE